MLALIKRASEDGRAGDAAAVLRELVGEPSGFIDEVLRRLGTSPGVVLTRLGDVEAIPRSPQPPNPEGGVWARSECFVPATPDEVWALLADPARMPEWEPGTGAVDGVPAVLEAGVSWVSHARLERPDGTTLRINPKRRTAWARLVDIERPLRIEWLFSWPDVPTSNTRRVSIQLEPAADGTQLHLTSAWERGAKRSRLRALRWLFRPLRPLNRLAVRMQLAQLGVSISRVFR
ncbi:MAG: SRPBCC domain-containing protein [Propionibacteriaceae bacterium]|nr:SRPBCC domain-containing protein [Propionibacteriaceae bacterium]